MSNSDIEQSGTVKGRLPNGANLSGRISNGLSLSGHISIGSVAGDFIIKMTVARDDNGNYTVASCDATIEQIDAAVAAEKRVALIAYDGDAIIELPMIQGIQGQLCIFGTFLGGQVIFSSVYKGDEGGSYWEFMATSIHARNVDYSNAAMPNISTVEGALDELVPNSHTHSNKSVLDKFSETDGKPTYDGDALGSDFIIKMTVARDDNGNYTVASCDATIEQIDAAVAAEKRVALIATDTDNNLSWDIPIVQGFNGSNYYFATFLLGQAILSFVQKIGENQARWQFMVRQIGSEFISYSNDALPNVTDVESALNELVPNSHTHANKLVLDKFSETDGKPTYNGEALGSGAGDFIIKITVEGNYESGYTVTSCDATVDQIDAAVANEKRVVVVITVDGSTLELPMIQYAQGSSYYFGAFFLDSVIYSTVYNTGNTTSCEFGIAKFQASSVGYSSNILPNISTVEEALNELISNSHTHANKYTLDKLSDLNGKLQYNGSDVGLKGDKGDTPVKGTDYWTAADKAEIVNDTLAALPTWTGGNY